MAKKKATVTEPVDKALKEFQDMMDKKFGDRALVEFEEGVAAVDAISTGLLSLDCAIGVGGMPRGRIVEIYGPEGSGKTTVAIKIAAECQKRKGQMPVRTVMTPELEEVKPLSGRVGFLDVEHAFNPQYAKTHGLDLSKGAGFMFGQPMSGTEAMQQLEYMIDSNLFDIVIVDSVAGLTTDQEESKDIGEQVIAGTAQLMSLSLKKLTAKVNKSRTTVIFINQIREKPAVSFGSPETTPGGRALKFYSSIRMRVSRGESISMGSNKVGHNMIITINKNKVAPPFQKVTIPLIYEAGFDDFEDVLKASTDIGVVELRGSSYQYVNEHGEIHKSQGKAKWKDYLETYPEVLEEIKQNTIKAVAMGGINNVGESTEQE